ncbi:MAG: peptidoglycan DD-metalloendopeptidase family protein [Defluviitaleaceae bacterium]|nr:peptidoglycan DD-metalloendopeptidase family protein [Defluviitaleaceae bacterium]MCL2262776.1 peptidoglycan DD-metalloendopeptidase family protein [Defluviitaleaceae bacterium]
MYRSFKKVLCIFMAIVMMVVVLPVTAQTYSDYESEPVVGGGVSAITTSPAAISAKPVGNNDYAVPTRWGNLSGNILNGGFVARYNGEDFVIKSDHGNNIFRNSIPISHDLSSYVNVIGGYVYHIAATQYGMEIVRRGLNGENRTVLYTNPGVYLSNLSVNDRGIYFLENGERIMRLDKYTGNTEIILSDENIVDFAFLCSGALVFSRRIIHETDGGGGCCHFDMTRELSVLSGGNKVLISDNISSYDVRGNTVYFSDVEMEAIRTFNYTSGEIATIFNGLLAIMMIYDDALYIIGKADRLLYMVDYSDNNITLLSGNRMRLINKGYTLYAFNAMDDCNEVSPMNVVPLVEIVSLSAQNFTWLIPVYGNNLLITSAFANRPPYGMHYGIDIQRQGAPRNAPVLASRAGTVSRIRISCTAACDVRGNCGHGSGNYIIINHHDGTHTHYGHLAVGSILVSQGAAVYQGQRIAGTGQTGWAISWGHLHFEIHEGGIRRNNNPRNLAQLHGISLWNDTTSRNINWNAGVTYTRTPEQPAPLRDGDFIHTPCGSIWRIAGGAPVWVSNWDYFGGVQPFRNISQAEFDRLPQFPRVGTFIHCQNGHVFRVIDHGRFYHITSWDNVGGAQPVVQLDSRGMAHSLNTTPTGTLDVAEGGVGTVFVRGWAFDRRINHPAVEIHVYIGDDWAYGRVIHTGTPRWDVNTIFPGVGMYRGFHAILDVSRTGQQNIRVFAINYVYGEESTFLGSQIVNITPRPTAPAAITNLTATSGNGQVTLNWTEPNNGGSAITRYEFRQQQRNDAGEWGEWSAWTTTGSTATTFTRTGLTNGREYGFQIRAANAAGNAPESNTPTATPTAPTPAPTPAPVDSTLTVSTLTASRGGEVTVTLSLANNPGFTTMPLRISFPEELTLVQYDLGSAGLLTGFVGPQGTVPGQRIADGITGSALVNWSRTANFTENGTLLTLTFAVSPDATRGTFPVGVSFADAIGYSNPTDHTGRALEIEVVNGYVQLADFVLGSVSGYSRPRVVDAMLIARHLAGHDLSDSVYYESLNWAAGKVTPGSVALGRLRLIDATMIARYLVGHNVELGRYAPNE